MRNRMVDETASTIIVTSDGTLFRCHVESIGGGKKTARHWIFVRSDRARYVGPAWTGSLDDSALCHLVEGWWDTAKALGAHFR